MMRTVKKTILALLLVILLVFSVFTCSMTALADENPTPPTISPYNFFPPYDK